MDTYFFSNYKGKHTLPVPIISYQVISNFTPPPSSRWVGKGSGYYLHDRISDLNAY